MPLTEPMSQENARSWMQRLLQGELDPSQMREALLALNTRPETSAELAGFAEAMRAASVTLPFTEEERAELVDTCGTGGDASGTFNISTAVALTAAACGVKIAKHGNRSVTSRCGSADVLEALGIPVGLEPEAAVEAIRKHNFAFLLATTMHPAMKIVAPVRREIGVRTIFNVLGPMTNPAGAKAQVMGVYSAHLVPIVAQALATMGVRRAMVVHGDVGSREAGNRDTGNREQGTGSSVTGGLDEISLSGVSQVAEVRSGEVKTYTVAPEHAGLKRAPIEALAGGDAEKNASILQTIFAGEPGPRRDVVLLNAAAVLMVSGHANSLRKGLQVAAAAIDLGQVFRLVELLRS